jgi:hypothetical protein
MPTHVSRRIAPALFGLSLAATAALAADPPCNRWWTPWIIQTPTAYFDSPQVTCATIESLYNQQNPNSPSQFTPQYVNNDYWDCLRDGQTYTSIQRAVRDDCCEQTIFGPYSLFPNVWDWEIRLPSGKKVKLRGRPTRGAAFAETPQKKKIRDKNKGGNTANPPTSDLWSIPELQDIDDTPCNGQLVENDPTNDCAAEIDHIIPRIDSKGCPCGTNSYRNAIVISRRLNGAPPGLGNDCTDPRRIRMIDYFSLQNNPITPYSSKEP